MQCAMAAIAYIEEKAERLLFARDWINTLDSTNKTESFIAHAVGKKTKHQNIGQKDNGSKWVVALAACPFTAI